ncbi:MAG TPA: Crp/Fnr family transcriptional regulator [Burkholderiaceae bacterium]|nr:Crp/Fnr family transcriptional regulator [Burkholderiaceae bacterium]
MNGVVESVVPRAAHWHPAQHVAAWREQGETLQPAAGPQPAARMPLASLVELLGGQPDAASESMPDLLSVHRLPRGTTLTHEGGRAAFVYVVQAGSLKYFRSSEDGYENVIGFAWKRDVIGLEALGTGCYAFSAVALEDSRAVMLPLRELAELRRRVPALDAALHKRVAYQLVHAGELAEVMAALSADTRLARFVLQLSVRMAERGLSPRRILLRMTRRDIAKYLGLAHETISRSFGVLVRRGCVHVTQREVEIVDLDALKQLARSTRAFGDEAAAAAPPHWARAA